MSRQNGAVVDELMMCKSLILRRCEWLMVSYQVINSCSGYH